MPEWIVIADDLTGANDTGVCFARRGLRTLTLFDIAHDLTSGEDLQNAQAWVLSTESRYLPEEEAQRAVHSAVDRVSGWISPGEEPRIYKKMDSALRGNPAVELGAVLAASGARRALAAPALPAQMRVTRGGKVFWREVPLRQTEFGAQITTDDLFELFKPLEPAYRLRPIPLESVRQGAGGLKYAMRKGGDAVWLADAETDADLDALAEAGLAVGVRIFCGSAGLASALARTFQGEANATEWREKETQPASQAGPVVVVVGTRSPQALRQVDFACQTGAMRLEPPLEFLTTGVRGALQSWAEGNASRMDQNLVVTTTRMAEIAPGGAELAGRLAEAALEVCEQAHPRGLALVGGDTAAAVFSALGCRLVELLDEVEPGMAWGRLVGGKFPGLAVITRAGSFGQTDSLRKAILFLEGKITYPHSTGICV